MFAFGSLQTTLSADAAAMFFQGAVRVDAFSDAVSLLIIVGAFLSLLAAVDYLRRHGADHGEFHCLVLWSAGAMTLFAQSNNLVMAFLSLETMSMAVYVLTAFLRDERRSVEGGLKYFVLGGFSTGFLLLGFVFLFGATRQIEFGLLVDTVRSGNADTSLLIAGLGLTLVGFGFKIGAFPFHSWVPDAYEGAPAVTTGFMAATVKVAGFAVLLRILVPFSGGLAEIRDTIEPILVLLAAATMIFGNVVAVVQSSVKRMLAYSAIGHTGYLLIGVVTAIAPEAGSSHAAIVFYLLPYSLATIGAFTLLGYVDRDGRDSELFEDYRGLGSERPVVAFLLLVIMISFAGIPPTGGFWAKLYLFREAVTAGYWQLALVGILTSIVSMVFYLRLVVNFYMRPAEEGAGLAPNASRLQLASGVVIAAAAIAIVVLGLFPDTALEWSAQSAKALIAP